MSDAPYLGKVFANVEACEKDIELDVRGHLPDWLKGSLIRLGPGLFDLADDFSVNHFFDGAAILYKYDFDDDHKVRFRSKFLETTAYQKMIQLKRPIFTEFGTCCYPDTTRGLFHRMLNKFVPSDLTDNVHGNIYRIGDEYFCASETCKVWKIDPNTLEAIEKVDLSKENRVTLASPHPLVDDDGNVYNIGASFTLGLKYHIMKIDAPRNHEESSVCQLTRTTDLTRLSPKSKTLFSYAHSFAMTKNYVILIEQPLFINSLKLITMTAKRQALREAFEWHGQKEKTLFHVVDKSTGRSLKTSFLAESFFFLHVINSFEDDDHIVIDIISYKDNEILNKFDLSNLRNKEPAGSPEIPSVRRYVIPLINFEMVKNDENLVRLSYTDAEARKLSDLEIILTPDILMESGFENPSINRNFAHKKYRFVYGGACFEPYEHSNSLIKLDTMTKNMVTWRGTSYQFPGEAFFIPDPNGKEEDDGVVLSLISDVEDCASNFLLVLDSGSFNELARIMFPQSAQICPTVHGVWNFKS